MFDYKQRPTTDEYRANWERAYGRPESGLPGMKKVQNLDAAGEKRPLKTAEK